jgi:hypothetical protein
MEQMQTRDVVGAQIRAQLRHADVVRIVRDAQLPPVQRALVVEYVNAAQVHDTRATLGGAQYLSELAEQVPNLPNLRATMRRLATAFVHPRLR